MAGANQTVFKLLTALRNCVLKVYLKLPLHVVHFVNLHGPFVHDVHVHRISWGKKVTFVDNEPEFRWTLLQDQMAFDKLHEGIKKFAEDGETLKKVLREKLSTWVWTSTICIDIKMINGFSPPSPKFRIIFIDLNFFPFGSVLHVHLET